MNLNLKDQLAFNYTERLLCVVYICKLIAPGVELVALPIVPVAQGGAGVAIGQALVLVHALARFRVARPVLAIVTLAGVLLVMTPVVPDVAFAHVHHRLTCNGTDSSAQGRTLLMGVTGLTARHRQVGASTILIITGVVCTGFAVVTLFLESTTSSFRVAITSSTGVRGADVLVRTAPMPPGLTFPRVGDCQGAAPAHLRSRRRALFVGVAGHATCDGQVRARARAVVARIVGAGVLVVALVVLDTPSFRRVALSDLTQTIGLTNYARVSADMVHTLVVGAGVLVIAFVVPVAPDRVVFAPVAILDFCVRNADLATPITPFIVGALVAVIAPFTVIVSTGVPIVAVGGHKTRHTADRFPTAQALPADGVRRLVGAHAQRTLRLGGVDRTTHFVIFAHWWRVKTLVIGPANIARTRVAVVAVALVQAAPGNLLVLAPLPLFAEVVGALVVVVARHLSLPATKVQFALGLGAHRAVARAHAIHGQVLAQPVAVA